MMSNKRKHESDDEGGEPNLDVSEGALDGCIEEEGGINIDGIYIPAAPRVGSTFDFTGPRLIITKIVNTNFKSYGEQQILGPFHKYFNSIVGPNGSGKSNVIDSMLFVFGYRASKIRSKKLSVLLHKSEQYPNVQSCSVAVHFVQIKDKEDDEDEYEEIPGSHLEVMRTVHKDNTSYYTLNGVRSQYKDVAKLLRQHGVDLDHNRFLILQGEVEQISLMKPKAQNEHDTGMLEYLEDIIGTTRFKTPLMQLDEKIETLSEHRLEKVNRVKLAEREKEDLREPMQEAVKFLELENEVIKKKNFIYQKHIKETEIKTADNEKEKAEIVEVCEAVNEKLQAIMTDKKTHEESYQQNNDKFDNLSKQKDKFTEEFNEINKQDMIVQADIVQTNNRRKKVIETLKSERNKLEDLKKVPERNQRDIEDYDAREKQLTEQLETQQAERNILLASLRDETISLQEEKEKLQTKLIDLRKVVDETKSQFTLADSELKLCMRNEETEKNKLETLRTTFEQNKQTLTQRSQLLKELKQKIALTEKQFKEAQTDLERVKRDEFNKIQEIKVLRVKIEESKSSMQASRSRGRVLDSLMQQKREGTLPGLFGRLGDLGAIDQKYDVAVSTACGPLDNIVVDTVDTAQWCIEFLKAHDIGRATFIALDKQEYLRAAANTPIKTPENVYRLFDLIRIEDERVKTAFYYALRDTLVASDLEQASRIAYGARRYRVVTLKGDLIETSGTMSGGGRTVMKGRMGQSVAVQTSRQSHPDNIMEMETNLNQFQENCNELRQRQMRLEDQVGTLQSQLRTMKIDLEKYTIEVQSLQQQQPALSEQLRKQEQKAKTACANPENIKKLERNVAQKKIEYEKAAQKSEELEKQVNKINNEIKQKTEKKMGAINKKITECSTILEKCKAELVKLKVAIKTAERNAKKCSDKISNMELEQTNLENRLIAMREERKDIEKNAAELLASIENISKELAGEEENFSEARALIAKLTKNINEIKAEKIEADIKLKEINKKLAENKKDLPHYQSKLAALKLQNIPEKEPEELPVYPSAELLETDTRHMMTELRVQEEKLKAAKPNLTAIDEFANKEQIYLQRVQDLTEVTEKRQVMRNKRDEIRKMRQEEFHAGFKAISSKLKEMYQMITLGGDAELEMVDSYDPFREGIVLNVRPPKKTWKNITNLSGGEKTLSSLALVFALHYYKPSPLYFMDEIDAALDFKNVSIVGNYIKERTKNAQFIIISLRNNMFELADILVGIYKTDNITKCATIRPRDFVDSDEEDGNENVNGDLDENEGLDVTPSKKRCRNKDAEELNGGMDWI